MTEVVCIISPIEYYSEHRYSQLKTTSSSDLCPILVYFHTPMFIINEYYRNNYLR